MTKYGAGVNSDFSRKVVHIIQKKLSYIEPYSGRLSRGLQEGVRRIRHYKYREAKNAGLGCVGELLEWATGLFERREPNLIKQLKSNCTTMLTQLFSKVSTPSRCYTSPLLDGQSLILDHQKQ